MPDDVARYIDRVAFEYKTTSEIATNTYDRAAATGAATPVFESRARFVLAQLTATIGATEHVEGWRSDVV